ncbi:hypothetical protein TSUD_169910 [Trifolium subterraneum]|nr:hypothetical protein TSUD_169910 [Trifolium subterraneum]
MLVDRKDLWFRVLAARYGVERGRLREGGRRGSSWWREIANVRDGEGGLGEGGLGNTFQKGWGTKAKSASVVEMFELGRGAGGEARAQFSDRWIWLSDPEKGYSVRGAYQLFTSQDSVTLDAAAGHIWYTHVPLKVSIFVWRLLRDRLPKKSNLVVRGIISSEAHHCVSGCGAVESAQHLFLSCSAFGSLWWFSSSSPLYAARLDSLCVEREKPQIVQRLNKFITTHVGQDC